MYFQKVVLNTGFTARVNRNDVSDDVIAAMGRWIEVGLAEKGDLSLPNFFGVDAIYRAQVTRNGGGLVCTVFGPLLVPLVTFGIATRSRHAQLWTAMVEQFGARDGLKVPDAPWCAVVQHPAYQTHQSVLSWIDPFVQSVAWARQMNRSSAQVITSGQGQLNQSPLKAPINENPPR